MPQLNTILPRFSTLGLLVGAFSVLTACALNAESPLFHYTLDGNTTNSGTASGGDGTFVGTPGYIGSAPGAFSQSLNLANDGNKDYMEADSGTALDNLGQMTITLWVNVQGALGSSGDRLVSNLDGQSAGNNGFDLRFNGSTDPEEFRLIFGINSVGASASSGASAVSADNAWAFVAVTYDSSLGSNQVSFYSGNESIAATGFGTAGSGNDPIALSSSTLRIGGTGATGDDRTPPAYFSDVRIYASVLSLGEIEDIRLAAIPEASQFASVLGLVALGMLSVRRRKAKA